MACSTLSISPWAYHDPDAIVPALHAPSGVELNWVAGVRERTGVATFVSGRFRTLEEAERVIASGEADMVGMTRATIADPHLVKKTLELGPGAVRPCIGCNQLCVGNVFTGQPIQCTVNPRAGREMEFPSRAIPTVAAPKYVVIVGGGPAGMEAARVAALAGHRVELYEATASLGGAVRLTANIPHLSGLCDVIGWLEQQVYELQVTVRTGSYLEAADIVEKNPDVVLVACGSAPRKDGWQLGAPWVRLEDLSEPLLVGSTEILSGSDAVRPGSTVVVVDDTGHAEAGAVAEYLVSRRCKIAFVTRFAEFAPQLSIIMRSRPALCRLNATGNFTLHTYSYIAGIARDRTVEIASFVAARPKAMVADHVLFVGFNTPRDALAAELPAAGYPGRVELIGDAKSPRYLHAAIHEGFAAAWAL